MRNPVYEQALNRAGVKWEYVEEVLLEDINREKGLKNQARLIMPVDPELSERYEERKKAGDEFPAVVLWRPSPRSKYIPVDGNNRLDAYSRIHRLKATDAYVIDTEDVKVVDFLTWTFNNEVNGKRLTPEENMEHGVTLVRMHGYSVTDAARACQVKRWQLEHRVRLVKYKEILQANNVKPYKDLPEAVVDRLGTLLTAGEDLFVEAVKAAGSTAMDTEKVKELIADVKAARSHNEKLKVVESYTTTPEAELAKAETRNGTLRRPKPTSREQLESILRSTMRLMEAQVDDDVLRPIGRAQFNQVQAVANAVVGRLQSIFKLS